MKKIIAAVLVIIMMFTLVGCGNKDWFDTVYSYDYAIVSFPDGTSRKIEIKQWTDYENGEQLQITDEDGVIYLVHAANCVLVKE